MAVIFWIWLSVVWWTFKNGISPMPTSQAVKRKIFASIPMSTQGTIYDLGSGWGTLAVPIARAMPHCQVIGYENSPIPYLFSKLLAGWNAVTNVKFLRRDLFKMPLNDASLVVCYLFPKAMERLVQKFNEELKPGTIIISNTFAIPGWEPAQVYQIDDVYRTRVYVYIKSSSYLQAQDAKEPEKQQTAKC
ncbi:MAG: methyltransferase domain-containing protein [Chlamydiales bacterium]|nr:methyltransferase domain-containing protein [Chlamydiia bacterium]MCP5508065.1 methyltransferase domain-containing protein [Chlamydiales bacterium]